LLCPGKVRQARIIIFGHRYSDHPNPVRRRDTVLGRVLRVSTLFPGAQHDGAISVDHLKPVRRPLGMT
jgi:hypothetical protein